MTQGTTGMTGAYPGSATRLGWKTVTVNEITTDGRALCVDNWGKEEEVPLWQYPKGALPAPGDRWYISRQWGGWNFALCTYSNSPTLVAPEGGGASVLGAIAQLFETLAAAGFFIDHTGVTGLVAPTITGTTYDQGLNNLLVGLEFLGLIVNEVVYIADTGWIPVQGGVGFQNSWGNRGLSGDAPAAYRLDHGELSIRGMISGGSVGNFPAFTLPSGFAPPFTIYRPCASVNLYAEVQVTSAGLVMPFVGSNTWFDLSGANKIKVDS